MLVSLSGLTDIASGALVAAGTSPDNARIVAESLVAADRDGLASHGVSRIPFYAAQAASGKVDGSARASVRDDDGVSVCVDAHDGFAFPAIRLGLDHAIEKLRGSAVVVVAISNSHHSGVGGHHVERLADHGAIGLGFTNTPAAIAPWGGSLASFGTNPIAFACPRRARPPLVVDLSLSRVARGRVMLAAQSEESIPAEWALDAQGAPTTDPQAALQGTMVPIGEAKGAALALVVEILAAGLTGSRFAFEADSFFTATGNPPRVGQSFVAITPQRFAGDAFLERIEVLLEHVAEQEGARLPGERRLAHRRAAEAHGVEISDTLYGDLVSRGNQS